ncbi:DUF1653 domain-containing protein [Streptomyces flaveolus]|uniref:DUF1653 domain-containing protein n=1 Tax=Streptomyces flaveolus TaxID=67297 RepID=UPI003421ADB5
MNHSESPARYVYEPGRVYAHHKGNRYRVLCLARHTETGEDLVVYQALYGDSGVWARPRTMFEETVSKEGTQVPRFTLELEEP